jgi:hypothetical protein
MYQLPRGGLCSLARNAKFVVSKDFVLRAGVENGKRGDLPLDGFHLGWMASTLANSIGRVEPGNWFSSERITASDSHSLTHLFRNAMVCGILDEKGPSSRLPHDLSMPQSSDYLAIPDRGWSELEAQHELDLAGRAGTDWSGVDSGLDQSELRQNSDIADRIAILGAIEHVKRLPSDYDGSALAERDSFLKTEV